MRGKAKLSRLQEDHNILSHEHKLSTTKPCASIELRSEYVKPLVDGSYLCWTMDSLGGSRRCKKPVLQRSYLGPGPQLRRPYLTYL